MQSIGIHEAKTNFSKILARVAKGESFTIEKYGVPMAILRPVDPSKKSVEETIAEIERFRKDHRLGRLSIRKMIDEGRR